MRHLGFVFGLFFLEAHLGAFFYLGFRRRHRFEPCLPPGDLFGPLHAVRHGRLFGLLRPRQQGGDFFLELPFQLLDGPVRQRAVPRGIGLELRPIQADRAQLQQLHLLRQFQYLHEQTCQVVEKAPPKARQGVRVRVRTRRDKAKRHRIIRRPFDLPTREHPGGAAIDQQGQQYRRVIRRAAPACVGFLQRADVQSIDDLDNEPGQVIFRQPFIYGRRKQIPCMAIHGAETVHLLGLSLYNYAGSYYLIRRG
jgi:hypothetical protein